MNTKKILLVSTYPIKNPKHGGQKRTGAIYDAYTKAFSAVKHSAVFSKSFYTDYDVDDIPLSQDSESLIAQSPLTGDIVCGEAIYKDEKVKKRMTVLLQSFQPDIIHIEQPFPYLGLKPLLKELNLKPKLVFGSQNIEAPMKREILAGAAVTEPEIQNAETIIGDLERSLSTESMLVVACTQEDLQAHKALGASDLVLAPNGIAKSHTKHRDLKHWQTEFKKQDVQNTVLFVGSAHPPNWTGFTDMVGKGLGFIPRDTRIVVAGSICDYFEREISPDNLDIQDATFWLRAISAGRLSERSLGALIMLSDVVLLPITEGGGSNLKTAEAILADKKVVATSHALRSFEWFKDFPNLWVADSPTEFRRKISEALDTPFIQRSKEQKKAAKKVEWSNCLADMIKAVTEL